MSFEEYIEDFYRRHPEWRSDKPAWGLKTRPMQEKAVQKPPQKSLAEQTAQDRLDWQQKASGEAESDWDAEEPK